MTRDENYRSCGFFLLRAPALPARALLELLGSLPYSRDSAGDTRWEREYAEGLLKLWAVPEVYTAIRSVTPDLAAAVDRFDELSAKDQRRAAASLGRYVNRMSVRATPLDLVAGVAGGVFGDPVRTRLGATAVGRTRARPDMGWVMRLAQRIAMDSAHASELRVRPNDLLYQARGRVWLSTADGYGSRESRTSRGGRKRSLTVRDNRAVSVRLTGPVRAVLAYASTPRTIGELRAHLADTYPSASAERIDGLLRELLDLDILLTAERPGMLLGGDTGPPAWLPATSDPVVTRTLDEIRSCVDAFNAGRLAPDEVRARVDAPARTVAPGYDGPILQIDSALDTPSPLVLPPEVARLAQDAAEVLARVTADQYPTVLREYADAFAERYGHRAEVPVLEVLSEESGLGPPPGYRQPQRSFPFQGRAVESSSSAGRDAVLGRLVSTALARRSLRITLDDRWVAELAGSSSDGADERPSMPTLDIGLQLSPPGPDRDRWRAVVSGVGVTRGGRTFGRFHDLLDPGTQASMRQLAETEERLLGDAIVAELTYLPTEARAANVSIRPALHDWELPVNVAPSRPTDRVIDLSDVLVGVANGRFYLRSRKFGRPLHITQRSLLSPSRAPNVCRFLIEVSAAKTRHVTTFEWGGLTESMPFLPRIERGDVVLRRARWKLSEAVLGQGVTSDLARFADALGEWADTWMAPEMLYLVQADNVILLDLTSMPSLAELRSAMTKAHDGEVVLEEALPGPGDGFLCDAAAERYVAEVVVPLVRNTPEPTPRSPSVRTVPRSRSLPSEQRVSAVGGDWVFAKLYAETEALDALITEDLAALAGRLRDSHGAGGPFFVRYADPAPHLRVRFPVPRQSLRRDILGDVAEWVNDLAGQGRITDAAFAGYSREVERYGGPGLIGHAERWFQDDSAAATLLLRRLPEGSTVDRIGLVAVSVERLSRLFLPSLEQRRDLARTAARKEAGSDEYRAASRTLWADLTGGGTNTPALDAAGEIWQPAASRFTTRMRELEHTGELWTDGIEIIRSLLHMHCNRMGLRRDEEETAYGIWRRLLDRLANTQR